MSTESGESPGPLDRRLDRLVLRSSTEGRRLYQRLGFVATNERRFPGAQSAWDERS